jgi:hypothetical protein
VPPAITEASGKACHALSLRDRFDEYLALDAREFRESPFADSPKPGLVYRLLGEGSWTDRAYKRKWGVLIPCGRFWFAYTEVELGSLVGTTHPFELSLENVVKISTHLGASILVKARERLTECVINH